MKLEATRGALAVGGFFVGGIALLLLGVTFFGDGSILRGKQHAVAYFDGSLSGLSVGAPVTFRGVRVGNVEGIELRIDGAQAASDIPVFLRLNPRAAQWSADADDLDIAELVRQGLRAQLALQSFVTGQMYIELDFYKDAQPPEPRGDGAAADRPEIPTLPSDYAQLMDYVTQLPVSAMVEALTGALNSIENLATQVHSDIPEMRDSALLTLEQVNETIPQLRQDFSSLQQDFSRIGEDIASVAKSMDSSTAEATEAFAALAEDMQATSKVLREAASGFAMLLAEDSPVQGDVEAMVHDLARASRALRNLTELLEEQPNRLIFNR